MCVMAIMGMCTMKLFMNYSCVNYTYVVCDQVYIDYHGYIDSNSHPANDSVESFWPCVFPGLTSQ